MVSVLYVHTRFDSPGGANFVAVETANLLSGHEELNMSIATARFNSDLYDLDSDVSLYELGGGSPASITHWLRLPTILSRLATIIQREDIDIVLFHSIPTPYWTVPLKQMTSETRYVWYAHDPNAYLNSPGKIQDVPNPLRTGMKMSLPLLKKLDRWIISNQVDSIIANSQFTECMICDSYDVYSTVIYPGIDVGRFDQLSPTVGRTIFTVGQLNKYKNFDMIIRAFADLNKKIESSMSLEVAGTGSYKQQLEEIAIEEGIDDQVKFLGYLSDSELVSRYAKAMVTVYLPENEPFGLVPVESMAAGTPVIAVDSGGIKETVEDGKTGLLLSTASEMELSNALWELFNSPELCESMGTAGRERVRSTFSIQHTAGQLADFFLDTH